MFVEHKQLKVLKLPASKVARLNTSGCNVQMAFPGYPPQMCGCYLVSLSSGNKVLVVVGFFLSESRQSIFYVPKVGEVTVEEAEETFEEGIVFAETMGFVLSETDYHMLSTEDQQKLWASLPICQETVATDSAAAASAEERVESAEDPLEVKSLGRFLSSM